jgi:hypothetical protein
MGGGRGKLAAAEREGRTAHVGRVLFPRVGRGQPQIRNVRGVWMQMKVRGWKTGKGRDGRCIKDGECSRHGGCLRWWDRKAGQGHRPNCATTGTPAHDDDDTATTCRRRHVDRPDSPHCGRWVAGPQGRGSAAGTGTRRFRPGPTVRRGGAHTRETTGTPSGEAAGEVLLVAVSMSWGWRALTVCAGGTKFSRP